MKKVLFGLTSLLVISFSSNAIAGGNIAFSAIKDALKQFDANQINKEKFAQLIQSNHTPDSYSSMSLSVSNIMEYCLVSATNKNDRFNTCSNFTKQVIAIHNKVIDQQLAKITPSNIKPDSDRVYTQDRQYYFARFKVDVGVQGGGGVFSAANNQLICYNLYNGDGTSEFYCMKDKNADIVFVRDHTSLVAIKRGEKDFGVYAQYAETLQSNIDYAKKWKANEKASISDGNCSDLVKKSQTKIAKTYTYVSKQSSIYKKYLDGISKFNSALNRLKSLPTEYQNTEDCQTLEYPPYTNRGNMEGFMGGFDQSINEVISLSPIRVIERYSDNKLIQTRTEQEAFNMAKTMLNNALDYGDSNYNIKTFTNADIVCTGKCNPMPFTDDVVTCTVAGISVKYVFDDICNK